MKRKHDLHLSLILIAFGLLCLTPIVAHCEERTARPLRLLTAMVAAQGADVATTCHALSTGRFREANGFLPNGCAGIASVKALTTAGALGTVLRLNRNHPKLAKVAAVAWVVSGAVPAAMNLRRMR